MRVLVLSCHLPLPAVSGGRRRELELLSRVVASGAEVELCAVTKSFDEDLRHLAAARRLLGRVALFPACPSAAGPPQVAAHGSAPASRHVRAALARRAFDVVHVEGFYLAGHVPARAPAPVLLVGQNVEHDLWERRAAAAGDVATRRRLSAEAQQTRHAEVAAWRQATFRAAVTEEDREAMLREVAVVPVGLVPDGYDHTSTVAGVRERGAAGAGPARGPSLLMVGNFAYPPNVDAALYLGRDLFRRIGARVPGVRLTLVGNAPPPEVTALAGHPDVTVTGRVRAVEPYLAAADVVVSPLRFGGGVKLKVLEALAAGRPVVTTPVGAQGLGGEARGALRVREHGEDLADAVVDLLVDPQARERLSARARSAVRTLPTWDDAGRALLHCYAGTAAVGAFAGAADGLP